MDKITKVQYDSLVNKIYSTLMNIPFTEDGVVTEMGMGEMGEAMEEAERIVNEWMEENNITFKN